jgi:alanyl-tRNA synthetase
MNSQAIRDSFVRFFAEREHREHRSVPLVPHGDPTLLFTNAGMVPFKDFFLGRAKPPAPRAVSVQKCMRVSGKHNDLENVGPSHRHHTFFEMLGNFSFGDYFKEEAIRFAWDLVTGAWGLSPEVLFATVFEEDAEAAELWRRVAGLPAERVRGCGAEDNFWAMGDTGPCGPCSEIFVDRFPERPAVGWEEGTESGRYLEIWNLVFMQFDRQADGELQPLPRPSVDTGAGLERVAAVLQGVDSNYETDLFRPILEAAAALAGTSYGADGSRDVDLRVIADHLRAVSFLLADGVIPGSEGRGYVLRRILRRAVRHGMRLGFEEPFLHRLVPVIGEVMGRQYPELERAERASAATVEAEEARFLDTLAAGSVQVQEAIEVARREGSSEISGEVAFRFYDTHGLPIDTLREIAEEERIGLDIEGFERALEAQRARSRAALGAADERLAAVRSLIAGGAETPTTRFVGYDRLESEGRILALVRFEGEEARRVEGLAAGESGAVVLDGTPFYAESGGQLGDRGELVAEGGSAAVTDTQKDEAGLWFHFVEVERGRLAEGDTVGARVDAGWRAPTQRNHTATHLLHAALRHVLGPAVRQAGSLVAPDRLRFDFTHGRPLAGEEVERIEDLVNRWVLLARATEITADRDYEDAVAAGAMALFGEKYGDRVRTVEVPGLPVNGRERLDSLELCGGCHVASTGEIGLFLVTSERGVASGVRRIEALTGEGARAFLKDRLEVIGRAASELGVPEDRVPLEAAQLRARARDLERELSQLRMQLVSGSMESADAAEVAGVRVLTREVPPAPANELRGMADVLKDKLGSGVVVLGSRSEDRVSLVTAVSSDLTQRLHAGDLARQIAALVDGSGGGRADFAQAGGRQPDRLPAALAAVPELIRARLER